MENCFVAEEPTKNGVRIPTSWVPWLWSVLLAIVGAVWTSSALVYRTRDEILLTVRTEVTRELARYVSIEKQLETERTRDQDYYKILNAIERLQQQLRDSP